MTPEGILFALLQPWGQSNQEKAFLGIGLALCGCVALYVALRLLSERRRSR